MLIIQASTPNGSTSGYTIPSGPGGTRVLVVSRVANLDRPARGGDGNSSLGHLQLAGGGPAAGMVLQPKTCRRTVINADDSLGPALPEFPGRGRLTLPEDELRAHYSFCSRAGLAGGSLPTECGTGRALHDHRLGVMLPVLTSYEDSSCEARRKDLRGSPHAGSVSGFAASPRTSEPEPNCGPCCVELENSGMFGIAEGASIATASSTAFVAIASVLRARIRRRERLDYYEHETRMARESLRPLRDDA